MTSKPYGFGIILTLVELGGLEPPSKHSTRGLSTRLVFL